jgi:hypothetical protein
MRLKPSTCFPICIMVVMVIVIGKALTFRYVQSALLPVLVGSLIFILAGLQAVREIWGKEVTKVEEKHKFAGEEIEYTKGMELGTFAVWFLGFCLAIYLLGHLIAVPLFSLSYVKWRGKSWRNALFTAAFITAFLYVLFPLAFKAEFYPGLIPDLIIGD